MSPTLIALRELAGEVLRPLVLWCARWMGARQPWADHVLSEEARGSWVSRGRS